eukprot:GGOE01060882.1.p4 GENE.GGOE01060882.1~~GGOE01060882.1.p4  ORF type:complete len:152 (-),score=7.93 GGOE01060882.1:817-1272(-)
MPTRVKAPAAHAASAASLESRRRSRCRSPSPPSSTSPSPAAKERLAALLASGQPLPKQLQETLGVLHPHSQRHSTCSSAPRSPHILLEVQEATHSPRQGAGSPRSKRADDDSMSISSTQPPPSPEGEFKRNLDVVVPPKSTGFWSRMSCCS